MTGEELKGLFWLGDGDRAQGSIGEGEVLVKLFRGEVKCSKCCDLNHLNSLRGGGVEVPQNQGH